MTKYHDLLAEMARTLGFGDIGAGELARAYYPNLVAKMDQAQQETVFEWLRILKASENLGSPRQSE